MGRTTTIWEARRLLVDVSMYDPELVERMPALDGDRGDVLFIHDKGCPSFCDYACGGLFVVVDGDGKVVSVDDGSSDGEP